MTSPLSSEFAYYRAHQEELVREHRGKVIVIKDQRVIGVYDDQVQAVQASRRAHELGTFLVQRVEPGEEAYSQTFHSRVGTAA